MALVLNGDGNVTGLTPGGLPDASITQADLAANIAGNGPVFSAYLPTSQSVSGSTWTKINMTSVVFDSHSFWDTTNKKFQPTIAGYYQISAAQYPDGTSGSGGGMISIHKNGSIHKRSGLFTAWGGVSVSALVYLNGTTDYIEAYGYTSGGLVNPIFGAGTNGDITFITGFLARAA